MTVNIETIIKESIAKASVGNIYDIPTPMRKNRDVALNAVKYKGSYIDWIDSKFYDDDEIMTIATKSWPIGVFLASPRLKDNEELMVNATQKDWRAFRYASDRIKNSKELVLKLTHITELAQHLSSELQDDKDVCKGFIINRGSCVGFFSQNLRENPEIMLLAIKNEPNKSTFVFKWAGPELKKIIGETDPESGLKSLILKNTLNETIKPNEAKNRKNKI